ncbi:MAG: hypothetical protein J6D29_08410 [Solobacterium sp.]|nr:hypothetical protein [Solobacterium sp.]
MGFFHRHNNGLAKKFEELFEKGVNETESEFLDSLNMITQAVEKDDTYRTNEKLAIYENLSKLSNCLPGDRQKYARKIVRLLR